MRRPRRDVLLSVAALTLASPLLAACDLFDGPSAPDPLIEFYMNTVALAALYDPAVAANPELAPIRDAHRAHAAALLAILTTAAPSSTPYVMASPGPGDLRAAEEHGFAEAVQTCLRAPAERATLLGEIAAARACHLEVLP